LAERDRALAPVPSYSSIRRFFQAQGWRKRRRLAGSRDTAGAEQAEARLAAREVRSYEAEYVGGLWHWDCHVGSRPVLTARGAWTTPVLFGCIDDRSRLACHLQWYLAENAECVAHGLSQAFQKRGLPRAGMSDNGAAMCAAEIVEGLARLGIVHETTLAYSPYHAVKKGTAYPATLLLSADSDDRVDPMHARKFAAALQAATTGGPVLLRIEQNAGHGGADMVKASVEARADEYAFVLAHTKGN